MKRVMLISLAAIAAFFGFYSGLSAQTIKIGAVVPLTGRYAALGAQVKTGYEIAVQQINAEMESLKGAKLPPDPRLAYLQGGNLGG